MGLTKREEIIKVAGKLFYESDYNSVSMRDIAKSMDMSVGNLTYYFNKKEDLIEDIILKQHSYYNKFHTPTNLKELNIFFQEIIEDQTNKSFYFKHYDQLADISPKVYDIQIKVIEDLNQILLDTFDNLKDKGLLEESLNKDNVNGLINSIVTLSIYGLTHFRKTKSKNANLNLLNALNTIVYLALSEKGKEEYSKYL